MSCILISIVILNYNGQSNLGGLLETCLESVLLTDYPDFEVLFVDNASLDESVSLVRRKYGANKRLRIIRNAKNYGFAEGNNIGIRLAKGQYIALLNSDTKVEAKWLNELAKVLESPEVGLVQSKLLKMNEPDIIDSAGGYVDFYGYHLERGRGESSSDYEKTSRIFYGKGAAIMIKRSVLEKTGLFDSEIFLYFDEVDLCWRIWLSGYEILLAPKSIVYHASGATASKLRARVRSYFGTRNHLIILLKNYSLKNLFSSVMVSILYEIRNFTLFLVRRKPYISISITDAIWWNLINLKHTWKKRLVVQTFVRRKSDEQVRQVMLKPYPPFPLYLVFSRSRYAEKE